MAKQAKTNRIVIENFAEMNPQVPQFSNRNTNYLIAGANPIYYLDSGTQEEQVAPLAASLDWLNINPYIIDSYSETNQNASVSLYFGSIYNFGQSFSVTNQTTLGSVQLYLKRIGAGTASIYAQIFAHTGTFGVNGEPTGTQLAISGGLYQNSLTTSFALTQFTFTGGNQITLTANTKYFVVITSQGASSSDCVIVGTSTSLGASGNAASSNGITWVVDSTQDMCFYVDAAGASSTIVDGNIVHMVPSTEGTYSVYAITDTTKVYGITKTAVTDLGYINGSTIANNGGYLAIGGGSATAGYLFATYTTSTIFKMLIPSSAWSNFGSITSNSGVHIMEPFLDYVALKDGNSSFAQGGLIKKIDVTALTVTAPPAAGLDLGAGFGIFQMRNYNNKYLAIAAGKVSSGGGIGGYAQNYLFLWDGISNSYQYSMKISGQFIDMKVIDSVLYVAVKVANGKTVLYYLAGTVLKKVFTTQIATIYNSPVDGAGGNVSISCALFDFKNYTGIHLNTTNGFTDSLLIKGSDEMGKLEFIHSYGRRMEVITPGYDGNLFASQYIPSGSSVVYYLPTSGTYQNISYNSQWIPVRNLQAIDVYYDTPPQSGTDAINVTIYGRGEDIITGTSTTPLTSITPTSFLNNKRTRLDVVGFVGDEVMVNVVTVNSTWQPIIRKIVLITK